MLKKIAGATMLLSASCLAGMSPGEVKVVGEIILPRCEVIAPNNGVYDFGKIKLPENSNSLPALTQSWRVKCDSAAYMDIIPEDNRSQSTGNHGAGYFSLGGGRGSQSMGNYRLGISNARIDRTAVVPQTAGRPMARAGIMSLLPGKRTRWEMPANVMMRAGPQAGRIFSLDITVYPQLTLPENAATEAMSLDGSATLDFTFGI
ncbi:hypothetical protein ACQ86O_07690 [Serratia sp. L9]|uniref:hypothetical protein n=1 Tax=Serratia sp. L9 TaxID=3423946 RepID=UPI003D67C70A